eukprot:scaffold83543_cov36-Tisochrysis_lutea.AAC.2
MASTASSRSSKACAHPRAMAGIARSSDFRDPIAEFAHSGTEARVAMCVAVTRSGEITSASLLTRCSPSTA